MSSFKLAFIVLLAFGAVQTQCAAVAEPEPKDLDVFLAAQQAIKIVKNVINAVEKGIQDSKPSVDILISQLTPEVGKAVKKTLDDVLAIVKRERERIEFMIKEVEDLLGALKKIKSCTDPQKKDIEKVIANLEDGLLGAVRGALKNQSEPLQDVKAGFLRILNKVRKLFDDEIKNVIECIKPGNPNAKKCLEGEIEKIKKGVISIAGDAIMFFPEAENIIMEFAMEVITRAGPVIENFRKESGPVMQKISDCIAKLNCPLGMRRL